MRKPNLTEREVYGKIASDAAALASDRLVEENYVDSGGTIAGSFTLDNKRQPTFVLEPIGFFRDYNWQEGVGELLDDCIIEAINRNANQMIAMSLGAAWSTPREKTKTRIMDDYEQGTLF